MRIEKEWFLTRYSVTLSSYPIIYYISLFAIITELRIMEFIRITVLGSFVNFFFMFDNSKLSVSKSMMMAVMFV